MAQPHIYRRFAWSAWDRWHWVARLDWFRRRRDARDAATSAWQAWHLVTSTLISRGRRNCTSTVVLRGRRGTDGTGWRAWTGLGAAVTPVTPRHFCVALSLVIWMQSCGPSGMFLLSACVGMFGHLHAKLLHYTHTNGQVLVLLVVERQGSTAFQPRCAAQT